MAFFPPLSSGAISQYPTQRYTGRNVGVIRFLDGSDQRFLLSSRSLRKWRIDLSLLTDVEMADLEQFFQVQQGMFSPFTFTDPVSNVQVQNCRIANPELIAGYVGINSCSASIWITETNG
jgi:hypothetical protein